MAAGVLDLDLGDNEARECLSGLEISCASRWAEASQRRAALWDLYSSLIWVSSRRSRVCACTSFIRQGRKPNRSGGSGASFNVPELLERHLSVILVRLLRFPSPQYNILRRPSDQFNSIGRSQRCATSKRIINVYCMHDLHHCILIGRYRTFSPTSCLVTLFNCMSTSK